MWKELQNKQLAEDDRQILEMIYDTTWEKLSKEEEIIFLDAMLSHPDEKIKEMAWKWYIHYKEEFENGK